MALQPTSSQHTSDYKLNMSTAHLLREITRDVRKHAPTARVSISPKSTWTNALAVASKSLEDEDQTTLIFPERSKEQREAIKKLALSEKPHSSTIIPPGSSTSIGRRVRTPFPKDRSPPLARPEAKEWIRKMAREIVAQGYRLPYTLDIRATLTDGYLTTVSGTLNLQMIDAEEDDEFPECQLVLEDMLWDTGSPICTITADILPERFANRLSDPKNDPYYDHSSTTVQVQGYLALSNSEFYFETIARVVPPSMVPNGRSGVILGQRCFMDHLDVRQVPRSILEARGQELKEDEWGDIKIIEYIDPVTRALREFPDGW